MVFNFKASVATTAWAERTSFYAASMRWLVVFTVAYPIDFLCLSVAKLMVLERMSLFAGVSKRWYVWCRSVFVLVVVGNVAGLVGNFFAAASFQKCVETYTMSSTSYSLNNTADGQKYFSLSQSCAQAAYSIASVQIFCETLVLLLIVVDFIVVGFACSRVIRTALEGVQKVAVAYSRTHQTASPLFAEAVEEGESLRRKIIFTTCFIFAAFLLRSVYSTWYAIVNQFQDSGKDVSSCSAVLSERFCSASCFNVYKLMHSWMTRTPEFQLSIVLLSSPLTLLVALRGMNTAVISQREQYSDQLRQAPRTARVSIDTVPRTSMAAVR